ncbi:hypothetical protein F3Y22_tig00011079pilonHSYRG00177 [Hibiscus syriacus]|uniref:Uncharacterized protein n=1 Tax=Hibiscus syriacus TaxID=106335 RepID=A0A6A3C6C2_HIBSY|nr:uncharacterized protein LOC120204609 [Hibiscus syriacus]KAE8724007.1 hypothetical protein F3Y22_tig00011079pilonHSYRG00177 [Hibiscus syriacus]
MALTLTISNSSSTSSSGNGVRILHHNHLPTGLLRRRCLLFPNSPRTFHLTSAAKKFRTGRFDSKNRRSNLTTKEQDDEMEITEENDGVAGVGLDNVTLGGSSYLVSADGKPFPDLQGLQPDPFEGPQWDVLGFLVQYLWAFGIVFALIACGIAVATYNEGATDFKETPAYKESIQSQELLEQPDASTSDVFESNPTEVAPSLE